MLIIPTFIDGKSQPIRCCYLIYCVFTNNISIGCNRYELQGFIFLKKSDRQYLFIVPIGSEKYLRFTIFL